MSSNNPTLGSITSSQSTIIGSLVIDAQRLTVATDEGFDAMYTPTISKETIADQFHGTEQFQGLNKLRISIKLNDLFSNYHMSQGPLQLANLRDTVDSMISFLLPSQPYVRSEMLFDYHFPTAEKAASAIYVCITTQTMLQDYMSQNSSQSTSQSTPGSIVSVVQQRAESSDDEEYIMAAVNKFEPAVTFDPVFDVKNRPSIVIGTIPETIETDRPVSGTVLPDLTPTAPQMTFTGDFMHKNVSFASMLIGLIANGYISTSDLNLLETAIVAVHTGRAKYNDETGIFSALTSFEKNNQTTWNTMSVKESEFSVSVSDKLKRVAKFIRTYRELSGPKTAMQSDATLIEATARYVIRKVWGVPVTNSPTRHLGFTFWHQYSKQEVVSRVSDLNCVEDILRLTNTSSKSLILATSAMLCSLSNERTMINSGKYQIDFDLTQEYPRTSWYAYPRLACSGLVALSGYVHP